MSRFRWTLTNLGDSTTDVLTKDPLGWEEMTLRLTRDKLYHGVFTEVTTSLRWFCNGGGKEFIDNVYATEDVNGVIEVLIEIDCDSQGTFVELYVGRMDLATYKTDGEFVTVQIEKSDLYSKLRARDEISVDLESTVSIGEAAITAPTAVQIPMHSQNIFLESSMEGDVPFTAVNNRTAVNSFTHRGLSSHQLTVINQEAESFTGWIDYDDWGDPGFTKNTSLLPEIFEAIDANVEYPDTYTYRLHFSGDMTDTVNGGQTRNVTTWSLVLAYGVDLNTATAINLFNSGGYSSSIASQTEAFDTTALTGTITLNYGDKVWLYWFHSGIITTGPYNDFWNLSYAYDNAEFSLEINSVTAESEAKSMLVHEAFNQVADAIADRDVSFYSEFYGRTESQKVSYLSDGCGSPLAITNGLNIREFPDKGIFCSLKDIFNSLNALHNIGLTIEPYDGLYTPEQDVIRVEQLSFFYDSTTQILNLTRPVKVETVNDNSRYINSIQIGYDSWESEFKGGLDEPCTKHEYSTQVNAIKGVYNKLSTYISSGYAIEFTRRKKITQTEDWRYDNDNFFIALKKCYRGTIIFNDNGLAYLITLVDWFGTNTEAGDIITFSDTVSNNGTFTVVTVQQEGTSGLIVEVLELVIDETVMDTGQACNETHPYFDTELYSDSFTNGTGMTSLTTAYNLRLTPARMLLAHMNVITACLQTIQGLVKFITGQGNTTLETEKNDIGCQEDYNESIPYVSAILSESQSFDWDDPNVKNITPLWIPEIYRFRYPLTASELSAVRANPHGYVQVLDDHNNTRKGFILDFEYSLKTGETRFELLRMFE